MSDFDAFGETTEQPPAVEEDPAAAFLAREQDELKGLEDDNFGESNDIQTTQEQQGDDFDPFTSGGDQMGEGAGTPEPSGDFFGGEPIQTYWNDAGEDQEEPVTNGPIDSYSAISQVDRQRAEPEKIRIWREENARRIEKKDEEEAIRKEEWKNIAKKELDDWYKHHDEQLTKTKENNRASEAAFVEDRDKTQPGEEWEKICRLCEFNPKNSKNTKDISRMRQILLQLKQTPLVR